MRYEILYKYGGIYIDSDCICIEPLNDSLLNENGFISYEKNNGLIGNSILGFEKNHQLLRILINTIFDCEFDKNKRAWQQVGPLLLTDTINKYNFSNNLIILPYYYFYPIFYDGTHYNGHGKVYCHHEWNGTNRMTNIDLDIFRLLKCPVNKVSICIASYNTKKEYLEECFDSIKNQEGYFFMEIIIVCDGSSIDNVNNLEYLIKKYNSNMRFCEWKFIKLDKNYGIAYSRNIASNYVTSPYIVVLDSDDIMVNDRIQQQLNFFNTNPDAFVHFGQLKLFKHNTSDKKEDLYTTNHPTITWNTFINSRSHWFANHGALMMKKEALIDVGNYNPNHKNLPEDYHLLCRLLKKYKIIYSTDEILIHYRIHDTNVTGDIKKNNNWDSVIDNWINSEFIA